MKTAQNSFVSSLLPYTVGLSIITFLCMLLYFKGIHNELVCSDLAILELQMQQLMDGRVLYFGMHSRDGLFHLGPSLYYALYPIYWLCGGATTSLYVGGLLLNGAALLGCAVLFSRSPQSLKVVGPPLVLLSMLALGEGYLISFYNVHVIIWWTFLFIFLCAFLASGRFQYLPWVVGVASWLLQLHFSIGPPVALIGGAAAILAVYNARQLPAPRYLLLSGGILLVFWVLPLLEWSNLCNVFSYFTNRPSAQPPDGLWAEMLSGTMFLQNRLLGSLIPVGLEWIAVVISIGITLWASWWLRKRQPMIATLGLFTLLGVAGLYWGLTHSPRAFWGAYFVVWKWALATTILLVWVTAALEWVEVAPCRHECVLQYCSMVLSLLFVVGWAVSADVNNPRPIYTSLPNAALLKMDETKNPPEVVFDHNHPWEQCAVAIVGLYKKRVPFQIQAWRWPFNLPPSYAAESTIDMNKVSMWTRSRSPICP
jgi:hypothetical protein